MAAYKALLAELEKNGLADKLEIEQWLDSAWENTQR